MKIKNNKNVRYQIDKSGELCCAICGQLAEITRFKNGYICTGCLQYVKSHR